MERWIDVRPFYIYIYTYFAVGHPKLCEFYVGKLRRRIGRIPESDHQGDQVKSRSLKRMNIPGKWRTGSAGRVWKKNYSAPPSNYQTQTLTLRRERCGFYVYPKTEIPPAVPALSSLGKACCTSDVLFCEHSAHFNKLNKLVELLSKVLSISELRWHRTFCLLTVRCFI